MPAKRPVSFSRMAEQDSLSGQVHHIHFAEISLAAQLDHGGHPHGGGGVAFRGIAVAVCHQAGGGEQRQLGKTPVRAEFLKMSGIARVSVFLQISLEAEIHPHRLGMAFRGHGRIHVKDLPLQCHAFSDLLRSDTGAVPLQRTHGVADKLRPQSAEHSHVIGNYVSHAGQTSHHADFHTLHGPAGMGGGGKVRYKRG